MLFNSYIFVLLFLPLCLVGYYILGHFKFYKLANVYLFAMSMWFYGYFNPWYLFLILGSVAINYLVYRMMNRFDNHRKQIFISGIVINVGILIYFKYMDFFISTINMIFKTEWELLYIVLPLGISFFTFQQISFITDAYRGTVLDYNILEYACYVTFFPQLIAGPIVTHDELVPQLQDDTKKKINFENMSKGLYLFSMGMAKKVLLADTFGNAVSYGYEGISMLNSTQALLVILSYTLQIYFDFSGYCDMAIGIGKMFNIELPLNFNSPYKATSIDEFWDRWHMTLTRFLTRYIYIPLGGNRKGKIRTYVNIMLVYLISGFWHGAGFTFLVWGIGHGIASVITRAFKDAASKIPKWINWIITFAVVNLLWVFFRSDTIADAIELISRVFTGGIAPVGDGFASQFKLWEIDLIIDKIPLVSKFISVDLVGYLVLTMFIVLVPNNACQRMLNMQPKMRTMVLSAVLLAWSIMSFSGISTFLYFNF